VFYQNGFNSAENEGEPRKKPAIFCGFPDCGAAREWDGNDGEDTAGEGEPRVGAAAAAVSL
jgi:hypothetical protein